LSHPVVSAGFDKPLLPRRRRFPGVIWVDNQLSGSAFLWQDGVITDLGVLRGGRLSLAFDINQRGDVTGYSYGANDGNEYQQGVLWTRRPIQ